ncbi:hypothetical protein D3C85_1115630 [compost metagenome]
MKDVSRSTPSTRAGGTCKPLVPPVNSQFAKMKCAMNEAAMVEIARYRPFTRSDGMPTSKPPSIATTPPPNRLTSTGVPSRSSITATVYAPSPMNAACPKLTKPV